MRNKLAVLMLSLVALAACDKHDPILPGTRTAIFDTGDIAIMNADVPNVPVSATDITVEDCKYTQDASNVIWDGDKKIFSGFPTSNSVKNNARPVCGGGYVYAGLTTGELVKVNPKNRHIVWIADIYRDSNLTGGSSVLDIVAPITLYKGAVYAGGIGDAFCKITADGGKKKWCVNVGVALPYIIADKVIYIVGTDSNLYAVRENDGAIYWRATVKKMVAPEYINSNVHVGHEIFNAASGERIK